MNILILGGTGAMGVPLVEQLSQHHQVYVTTRKTRVNKNKITYLQGNAHDLSFVKSVLEERENAVCRAYLL